MTAAMIANNGPSCECPSRRHEAKPNAASFFEVGLQGTSTPHLSAQLSPFPPFIADYLRHIIVSLTMYLVSAKPNPNMASLFELVAGVGQTPQTSLQERLYLLT